MKTNKRAYEPVSDATYRKLLKLMKDSAESKLLAEELGKIICEKTREKQRKTDKAEYARTIAVQILKNESVEETLIAECGTSIEDMLSEAEKSAIHIIENRRMKQNEKNAC